MNTLLRVPDGNLAQKDSSDDSDLQYRAASGAFGSKFLVRGGREAPRFYRVSYRMETKDLMLQVGLSGEPLRLTMNHAQSVLEVKHEASQAVAKLLGKEFLSTDLMSLIPDNEADALKDSVEIGSIEACQVVVGSTPPDKVFGLSLQDEQNFVGGILARI